jgi:hypothetical protein
MNTVKNGKGSDCRISDFKTYRKEWDNIFNKKNKKPKAKRAKKIRKVKCPRCNGSGNTIKMDDSYSCYAWPCEYCQNGYVEQ